MADFDRTDRTTLRRRPDRGSYDRALAYAILDEALLCHVGFAIDGHPSVVPTLHWRDGDDLLIHGSAAGRPARTLGRDGLEACVTVMLADSLVLARSGFHHSINYRSVMAFGHATLVPEGEKPRAFDLLIDKIAPGRSADLRPATASELKQTAILRMPLTEASVKVRATGVVDEPEDYDLPIWAGVVPLTTLVAGAPVPDERNLPGVEPPPSVAALLARLAPPGSA
jgi:nitroimidazol reductase NimA-like FMN-containing flavoprotein (pyridoxamine 5'-phosphate oxidase superfamily)